MGEATSKPPVTMPVALVGAAEAAKVASTTGTAAVASTGGEGGRKGGAKAVQSIFHQECVAHFLAIICMV